MGNKVSAVHGVRSDNFFEPGNAVNEVWVGDLEVVSRLPFGDSDMAQAAWPKNDYPKIPWRPFIIPLRATVGTALKSRSLASITDPDTGWLSTLRSFADTRWTLVCWVLMQIFALPLLMMPIALHLVPQHDPRSTDDDFPSSPVRLTDDESGQTDDSPRRRHQTAFGHALLGSVCYVLGVLLAFGFDHGLAMDLLRPSRPMGEPSDSFDNCGSGDFFGLDVSTIYAAMSMALVLNSAYSVFRLWWTYLKSSPDAPEDGDRHVGEDIAVLSRPPEYTDEEVSMLLL
ncbi:hypothetical protein AJ79_01365 [Helicocarpus griseus UAMH5409]|uniref:Uncharacterized protein n=1 Tax=Helicocarpus griseus UAMH5409 TaxID=1447875 RepID=A0A2B7Y7E8_9EURO|nr:hypothetical protein AJ79_01365 [Helicocarpus griseus UAMH5409]